MCLPHKIWLGWLGNIALWIYRAVVAVVERHDARQSRKENARIVLCSTSRQCSVYSAKLQHRTVPTVIQLTRCASSINSVRGGSCPSNQTRTMCAIDTSGHHRTTLTRLVLCNPTPTYRWRDAEHANSAVRGCWRSRRCWPGFGVLARIESWDCHARRNSCTSPHPLRHP